MVKAVTFLGHGGVGLHTAQVLTRQNLKHFSTDRHEIEQNPLKVFILSNLTKKGLEKEEL